jgi:hypothetical protein
MRPYNKVGNEKKQDIEGRHYWVAVVAFVAGATLQLDDGQPIPVQGNWVLRPPLDSQGRIVPWKQITTTGTISLLIGENREPSPPSAGQLAPQLGAVGVVASDIVAVGATGAGAATKIVSSNSGIRSIYVQNHSAVVVVISTVSPIIAPGVGSGALALLAACAVAFDGTGGALSLDGLGDDIFAAGVGGAANLSVTVY